MSKPMQMRGLVHQALSGQPTSRPALAVSVFLIHDVDRTQ